MSRFIDQLVPTVLLRHDLPDGSWHIDWLIAPPESDPGTDPALAPPPAPPPTSAPPPEGIASQPRSLLTLRLTARPDELAIGEVALAHRLPDHRWAYLSYEGDVSGERGFVHRLRRGAAIWQARSPERWVIAVRWEGEHSSAVVQGFRLEARGESRWRVERTRQTPVDRAQ